MKNMILFPIATVSGACGLRLHSLLGERCFLWEDFFLTHLRTKANFVSLFYVRLKNPNSTNSGLSFGIRQNGSELWIWPSSGFWWLYHCQEGNDKGLSEEWASPAPLWGPEGGKASQEAFLEEMDIPVECPLYSQSISKNSLNSM